MVFSVLAQMDRDYHQNALKAATLKYGGTDSSMASSKSSNPTTFNNKALTATSALNTAEHSWPVDGGR